MKVFAPLVGMRHHPGAVEKLTEMGMDEVLILRREPENPHDKNAIQVFEESGELLLGYIARDFAAQWAPIFDRENAVPEARLSFSSDGRPQVSIEIDGGALDNAEDPDQSNWGDLN